MKSLKSGPSQEAIAAKFGVHSSSIRRWRKIGAPVNGTPAELLEWWSARFPAMLPPPGLVAAAASGTKTSPCAPVTSRAVAPLSIEQAVEAQRRNLGTLQHELVNAQRRKDAVWAARWSRSVERTTFSLSRLETVAGEVADADRKWLPVATLRNVWRGLGRRVHELLYREAEDPARHTLRQRWDQAVAALLMDPFGDDGSQDETSTAPADPAAATMAPDEGDIEQANEAQRLSYSMAQAQLEAARAAGDPSAVEAAQQEVNRAGLGLARIERLAVAARPRDKRWASVTAFAGHFHEVHGHLNERLYQVAADPDRASLRERWDAAVRQLLEDPFAGSPTTPAGTLTHPA